MEFASARQLLERCLENNMTIPRVVQKYESIRGAVAEDVVYDRMAQTLEVMRMSVAKGVEDTGEHAHLVHGYGSKIQEAINKGNLIGGQVIKRIILYSLAVAQHNASLGRIVACPTAGSCGVVPGALLPVAEEMNLDDDLLIDALFVTAGIGIVSAAQGPISGAEGGCQAECGVASAMAAGALVFIAGGNGEQVFSAASLALQGLLGLVCDPVAGLVEVPCVTRNATAAVNALASANMVLAGISAIIPYDETVQAMKAIGKAMPESLRETSLGGVAATPTAKRIFRELKEKNTLE